VNELPGRILAVDPGRVRVGLAVSDPSGTVAQGLPSLQSRGRAQDAEAIGAIVRERGIVEIVVGCRLDMTGGESPMSAFARSFAEALGERAGVPVRLWDERLTSAQAERTLLEVGARRRTRREQRDRIAAVLILQGYLDWRARHDPA